MSKQTLERINVELAGLKDAVAERLVLSCLIQNGDEIFYDIDNQIKDFHFYHPENKIIYAAIGELIVKDGINKPTTAAILGKINNLDNTATNKFQLADYIGLLTNDALPPDQIKPFLNKVAKFGLARGLIARLQQAVENIKKIDGSESLLEIISKGEQPIAQFTQSLVSGDDTNMMGEGVVEYLEHLGDEAGKLMGISTGMPFYDKFIGGGLRAPGIHLVGARSKEGKSFLAINIANAVTKKDVPVLYLDTELTRPILWSRWLALESHVDIDMIESGAFKKHAIIARDLKKVAEDLKTRPLYYHNISGKHHTEWISLMRRWIMKRVGFDDNGNVKPCVIVLDYIKMMNLADAGNFAEYQYLGQMLTDLHNFCIQYNIPIFSLIQLNREGITKEDQSIIAGSDRILHLCSSFSIFKKKTQEDYADEANGPHTGNKKLIVVATRFGPGTDDGEYINLHADLAKGLIQEGRLNVDNRRNQPTIQGNDPIHM